MNYDEAFKLASQVKEILAPYCERIEIAGSIRRKKREGIKDIEIVCQPRFRQVRNDIAGEFIPVNELHQAMQYTLGDPVSFPEDCVFFPGDKRGPKKNIKAPFSERYYAVKYKGEKLDIFAVLPPAQWGTVLLIRTGDADFSHAFVTRLWDYGLRCKDGHIEAAHIANIPIVGKARVFNTPEETDAFRLAGMDYIEPENRTLEAFR